MSIHQTIEVPGAGIGPWHTRADFLPPEPETVPEIDQVAETATTTAGEELPGEQASTVTQHDEERSGQGNALQEQVLPGSEPVTQPTDRRIQALLDNDIQLRESVWFDEDGDGYFNDPKIVHILVNSARQEAGDTPEADSLASFQEVIELEETYHLSKFWEAYKIWFDQPENPPEQVARRLKLRSNANGIPQTDNEYVAELKALQEFLRQQMLGDSEAVSTSAPTVDVSRERVLDSAAVIIHNRFQRWSEEGQQLNETDILVSSELRKTYMNGTSQHQDIISTEEEGGGHISMILNYPEAVKVVTFYEHTPETDIVRVRSLSKLARGYMKRDVESLLGAYVGAYVEES